MDAGVDCPLSSICGLSAPTLGPLGPTSSTDSGSFKILMLVIMNFCIFFFFQTLYHNLTGLDY